MQLAICSGYKVSVVKSAVLLRIYDLIFANKSLIYKHEMRCFIKWKTKNRKDRTASLLFASVTEVKSGKSCSKSGFVIICSRLPDRRAWDTR